MIARGYTDAMLHRVELPGDTELHIPESLCCNCGATEALERVRTPVTRFAFWGGAEWSLHLHLPHCPRCKETAGRIPPSFGKRIWLTVFWTWLVLSVGFLLVVASEGALRINGFVAFAVSATLAAAGVAAWYARRRPTGEQTSYYQAVRLLKLGQGQSAAHMQLGFTHEGFARRFIDANPQAKGV